MTSELVTHLTTLLDRWENLSTAAEEQIQTAGQPVQSGFYAGVLFSMVVAREELAAALASAMVESAKTSSMMSSAGQPLN